MTDTTTTTDCLIHIHALCPHCGGQIALVSHTPAPPAEECSPQLAPTRVPSPTARLARMAFERLFPITHAIPQAASTTQRETPHHRTSRRAHWMLMAATLLLVAMWLFGETMLPNTTAPERSALPIPTLAPQLRPAASEQAALLAVVAQYNTAESQVAATLVLDPLLPLLDDRGPLLARRTAELDQRRQAGARHTTRLLRWAVGAMTLDTGETTATLVTQETWENQEHGAVAPQTATVRVTYTLRRSTARAPWRIADASSALL